MHAVNQKYGLSLPELTWVAATVLATPRRITPRSITEVTESIAASVAATCERLGMAIPHMSFEPGRSISGPSGATLYTVGTIKNVRLKMRTARFVCVATFRWTAV